MKSDIEWPVKILIHMYGMQQAGYIRVTERDLVRQFENLRSSIRIHLTRLEKQGMVELSAVSAENCFVRLTADGQAFVEEGMRRAEQGETVNGTEQ
jgi:DNA-binding MarR family transcriptional regulator